MKTIEVDFEVWKEVTAKRNSEEESDNDVLREILGLGKKEKRVLNSVSNKPWITKGVTFPHGTPFKGIYKGQEYSAKVENGALIFNGKRFKSPSGAAVEITESPVNGWRFWECKMPGEASWVLIDRLRKKR